MAFLEALPSMVKGRFVLLNSRLELGDLFAFLVGHADFEAQLLQLGPESVIFILQEEDKFYQLVKGHLFKLGQIVARHGCDFALLLVQILPRLLLVNRGSHWFQNGAHGCALRHHSTAFLHIL